MTERAASTVSWPLGGNTSNDTGFAFSKTWVMRMVSSDTCAVLISGLRPLRHGLPEANLRTAIATGSIL